MKSCFSLIFHYFMLTVYSLYTEDYIPVVLVDYVRSSREIFTQGKVEYTAFVVVN